MVDLLPADQGTADDDRPVAHQEQEPAETWWHFGDESSIRDALPTIRVELDPPRRRITVDGELDHVNGPILTDAMSALLTLSPGDSSIAVHGVSFVDAGGVGALVGCRNQLAEAGATLTLLGVTPAVRRLLHIVGLSALVTPRPGQS